MSADLERVIVSAVLVYAVVDESLSPTSPLGNAIDTFVRREDAERFITIQRGALGLRGLRVPLLRQRAIRQTAPLPADAPLTET